jgi:hypothetical protein
MSYGLWTKELPLEFPHLKTLGAGSIRNLVRVIAPSVRHVVLTDMTLHARESETIDTLLSHLRVTLPTVETLHLKQMTNISVLFYNDEVCKLFPDVQTLILDLDTQIQIKRKLPISLDLRFRELDTLKLMAHSLEDIDDGMRRVIKEIASFNRHEQQTIRRIELHGWGKLLDAAVPIILRSLPPGVEFCPIETVTPILPRVFGWN